VIPLLPAPAAALDEKFRESPLLMLPDADGVAWVLDQLKARNPRQIVAIRLDAKPDAASRVLALVQHGAEMIHLLFDAHGREKTSPGPRHMRDVLREVHGALVKVGVRDQVTISASGGIAQAEHLAKAIVCGADLVAVDLPLLLAMECRLCDQRDRGGPCPIALEEIAPEFAVQRVVNLIGAWHQQLIEVLGAMGIREVRRLRGETGRAMFFEDLERDSFGRLFGTRKDQQGATAP
jgi:hypothetical protein